MADLVIKRKENKPIISGKIELLVDGEVKLLDLNIYPIQAVKIQALSTSIGKATTPEEIFKFLKFFKEDILNLSEEVQVSEDELFVAFASLGEQLKNVTTPSK